MFKINGDCSSTKLRKEFFRGCKGNIFLVSKGHKTTLFFHVSYDNLKNNRPGTLSGMPL